MVGPTEFKEGRRRGPARPRVSASDLPYLVHPSRLVILEGRRGVPSWRCRHDWSEFTWYVIRVGFGLLLLTFIYGSAGIPTIIKPFFGDQFFWSDRVEALGIGSSVRKLTVENLTAALRTATTDVKQIEKAKLVGQSIRSVSGTGRIIVYC